jgi:hypothetical protein
VGFRKLFFSVVAREDLKYKTLKKDTQRRLLCEEVQGTRGKSCSDVQLINMIVKSEIFGYRREAVEISEHLGEQSGRGLSLQRMSIKLL